MKSLRSNEEKTSDRIRNKLYKEEIWSQKYINIVRKETTTIIRSCKDCKYNKVTENGVRIQF
jgi:hypothetical protein